MVGGGASGALLLIEVLGRAGGPLRIDWVDTSGDFARGLAYGAAAPWHLLNVPAGRMSALEGRPDHFLAWCRSVGVEAAPSDYLPRHLYGRYLVETLEEAQRRARPLVRIERRRGEVVRLLPERGGWRAILRGDGGGATLRARQVALALGNPRRSPPPGVEAELFSPWDHGALGRLAPDADLLLLGTGLTMVDAFLSLDARGHRGRRVALSRHGLLPRPHRADPQQVPADFTPPAAASVRELSRAVRAASDWRAAVDGLRPHIPAIWQGLSPTERRRFLRHLRAHWEVHRHRVPLPIWQRLAEAIARGGLEVRAGRVVRLLPCETGVELTFRLRGAATERVERFAAAIDCTGPATSALEVPLLRALVEDGVARPDPAGLGLATAAGVVADAPPGGGPLLAIGPMRRGERWESTAIPEIRVQAAELAVRILGTVGRAASDGAGSAVGRLW